MCALVPTGIPTYIHRLLTRVRFSGTGGEPSKGGREAAQGSIAGATIDGKG